MFVSNRQIFPFTGAPSVVIDPSLFLLIASFHNSSVSLSLSFFLSTKTFAITPVIPNITAFIFQIWIITVIPFIQNCIVLIFIILAFKIHTFFFYHQSHKKCFSPGTSEVGFISSVSLSDSSSVAICLGIPRPHSSETWLTPPHCPPLLSSGLHPHPQFFLEDTAQELLEKGAT